MQHKILIVEDEDIIRKALRKLLERNGFEVTEAASVAEAEDSGLGNFQLVISDVRLPGAPGTDLIALAHPVPVLIMTSYGSMRAAVDAMKQGAVDYISKPFDHKEMIETVTRILSGSNAGTEETSPARSSAITGENLTENTDGKEALLLGQSDKMQAMARKIDMIAPTETTALIIGETGTGKELVAQTIHQRSKRNTHPFITVNCASMPDAIIEAELFGYEKGAVNHNERASIGLIAAADGGTLFLDEIGELPLESQARLLTVLQENRIRPIGSIESRPVDFRLVASTHQNLKALCSAGRFREDLYFRINVIQIDIPPLRERGNDIITLARSFITSHAQKNGIRAPALSDQAEKAILAHHWPGNVRELQNAVQRAMILSEGSELLDARHFDLQQDAAVATTGKTEAASSPATPTPENPEKVSLDDYFRNFVLENQTNMSETELAKQLGISRKSLWEKRQKLGIPKKSGK